MTPSVTTALVSITATTSPEVSSTSAHSASPLAAEAWPANTAQLKAAVSIRLSALLMRFIGILLMYIFVSKGLHETGPGRLSSLFSLRVYAQALSGVPWYKQNRTPADGQYCTASEDRAGLDTVQVPSIPASTSAHSSQVAMSAVPA